MDTEAIDIERKTAGNSTYPKVAIQWLNQALCFSQSLCLVDNEVRRNRHLRVAANRYSAFKGNLVRQLLFIIIGFLLTLDTYGQQDTVFIKHSRDWTADSLVYVTDTVIFPSGMVRHILTGTTILPWTTNQQNAKGAGLYLKKVSKSECKKGGEETYWSSDKINSITKTDSSLIIDLYIYDNCCFDFLCDASIDSAGIINLIYYGYGTNCSCRCCFGLTYEFSVMEHIDYQKIKEVLLNGNRKTLKSIN